MQEGVCINFLYMDDTNPTGKKFAAALTVSGIKPADLARELKVLPQRINHWKKRGVSARYSQKVAKLLGVDAGQIASLEDDEPLSTTQVRHLHSLGEVAAYYSGKSELVSIPKLNVSASMGKGLSTQYMESVVEEITVEREWLRRNVTATSPDNLALISAYGDSMEGTFSDGDLLLVDRGITEIKLDAVYVLALNDELFIKRLQRRPDGTMLMLSDNSKYSAYEITSGDQATFRVLGRVLLAWNVRRL